jgi:hypothetical protein
MNVTVHRLGKSQTVTGCPMPVPLNKVNTRQKRRIWRRISFDLIHNKTAYGVKNGCAIASDQ